MTIFAGAVAIDRGSIPIEAIETLRGALSRHPGDEPRMHRGEGWTVVQLVLPTEIHPCEFVDEVGSATFLAGRPLIGAGARPEIEALHAALRDEDRSVLQRARGSFCALHVDARGFLRGGAVACGFALRLFGAFLALAAALFAGLAFFLLFLALAFAQAFAAVLGRGGQGAGRQQAGRQHAQHRGLGRHFHLVVTPP